MYVCMFCFFLSHESNVSGGVGILVQIYFVATLTRPQIQHLTQGCNLCMGILNAMYYIHMRTKKCWPSIKNEKRSKQCANFTCFVPAHTRKCIVEICHTHISVLCGKMFWNNSSLSQYLSSLFISHHPIFSIMVTSHKLCREE